VHSTRKFVKVLPMPRTTNAVKNLRAWKALRRKAEQLLSAGERQAAVARTLGVSRQCIHNWLRETQRDQQLSHKSPERLGSGRRAKLDAAQLARVDRALRQGPHAAGIPGQRWTLWRVASVIKKITGIEYHPSSVWRILRAMGWRLRRPLGARRKNRAYVARHWSAPPRKTHGAK
jgi:transposase